MIYVLLPLYNEEKRLKQVIERIRYTLSGAQYKIIAINDGSCDNTLNKLHQLKRDDLIIHSHKMHMGMGAVIAVGFNKALLDSQNDSDIVVTIEPGISNYIGVLRELYYAVTHGSDITIASRYKGKGAYINFPFVRKMFSRAVNRLLKIHFPILGIRDYTIFLRSYRLGIVKEAVKYFGKCGFIQSRGFVANVELLIKLSLFTENIKEIPCQYDLRDNEARFKIKILSTINEYFVVTTYLKRIFKKMERLRKSQRKFEIYGDLVGTH